MKEYIENVKNYIPPNNTGYRYVKHITVYTPVKEFCLEILERRRQQIPFLYETILSLLNLGITDITLTARILGLEMDVYTEIISQMAFENYLFVSNSAMGLTNKGLQSLTDLKKVTIKRKNIKNIFVNMVTGKIYDEKPLGLCKTPRPSCMCLDQSLRIDIDFFRKQIEQVTKIFQNNAKDEAFFDSRTVDREIYRLLKIVYENILFLKSSCFVFISSENNEVLLSFEDDNDLQYLSAAMTQIRNRSTGAMKIFDFHKKNYEGIPEIDQAKLVARDELIDILKQREKSKISTKEIENKYYTSRYLLSGEVETIVNNCGSFKPKTIFIMSPKMRVFLESSDILSAITSSSVTRLILVYNSNEYNVQRSITWLKQSFQRPNLQIECYPQPLNSPIITEKIIADPCFLISIYYQQISISCPAQGLIEEELADITFDPLVVSGELTRYIHLYQSTI